MVEEQGLPRRHAVCSTLHDNCSCVLRDGGPVVAKRRWRDITFFFGFGGAGDGEGSERW